MAVHTTKKYYETINEFVSKLSFDWFQKKEGEFKNQIYYQPDNNKIFHIDKQKYPTYDFNYETGEEFFVGCEEIDTEIEIDLRRYCSCYLPINEITNWGSTEFENYPNPQSPSNNIYDVAYELVKEISKFSDGLYDVVAVSGFVSKTISSIDEELNKLKKASPNEIYACVLDDFLKACSSRLYSKYEKTLTVYELTRDYTDQLNFDISQEEMVSLLYILAQANIIKTPSEYEYKFIPFCFKYFTVKKGGESVRLANEKVFTEAYRRILKDENGSGLFKIKQKLDPVLKKIIK